MIDGGGAGGSATSSGATGGSATGGAMTDGSTAGSDAGGGNTGGDALGGQGGACPATESCAQFALDCAGEPPDHCASCNVLWCGISCCTGIGPFAADISPQWVDRPQLVTDAWQGSEGVGARFHFDVQSRQGVNEQVGALSIVLDEPRELDPNYIALDLALSGTYDRVRIGLDRVDGGGGCLYDARYERQRYRPNGPPVSCWGGFLEGWTVQVINVRLESQRSGVAELEVRYVSW